MVLDVVLEAQFQQPTSLPGGSVGKSSALRRQRVDEPDIWGITVAMYLTPFEESGCGSGAGCQSYRVHSRSSFSSDGRLQRSGFSSSLKEDVWGRSQED